MEFKSLADVSLDCVLDAFNGAFADYAVAFDRDAVARMLVRRGFCPELSYAAFDGGNIVAFTLNGIGERRGVLAAYDTGTGTLPDYRGRKLAGAVFEHSVPRLKGEGVGCYLLEVLQENKPAVALYESLGFERSAEYECFVSDSSDVRLAKECACQGEIGVRPVSLDAMMEMTCFRDFEPSWQNSDASMSRGRESLIFAGAYSRNSGEPLGYCAFDPLSGDVAQIATRRDMRRRGVATELLRYMLSFNKSSVVKVINVPPQCDSLKKFIAYAGIAPGLSQYEMVKTL